MLSSETYQCPTKIPLTPKKGSHGNSTSKTKLNYSK
uniref:Uncharacterized protein n=1 Tax=Rhizophora mucronata TaxID=61149 RepID=A0A2P2NMR3_RHIMU